MGVNHYDDLFIKIISLGRSYKAPSFISNTYHVNINL
jgi:hypothetical protein